MSNFIKFHIFNTYITIKHYLNGPPRPSWDLKFHLTWAMLKSALEIRHTKTIEQAQKDFSLLGLTPADVWKDLKDDGIISEWVQNPNDGWENREIRKTILTLAKKTNARVLVINYRLAPQNQFPAALQDADSDLTSCAGIIGLSPWVDLTQSTPSVLKNDCIDYVPKTVAEKAAALTAKIKNQNLGPKIWHDSFDRPNGRFQLYAPNEALAIPYVSPMLAESLCNFPPLLLTIGDDERLRDKTIYFAHRSSEPTKYKGPSYNAGKFEKSPFQTPTNTTLEIYEDMPHVFQFMEHASTEKSYERMAEFIDRVTNSLNESLLPSSYNYISAKGEISPSLKEYHKEVLKWEKIGILPSNAQN
ncbi:alpha/beta hydrolase protein [Rhizophagus clarus]|uniref:Alpha/beta hydrolase protein n=2 Tax=Rhizophagus clarus TaxID=94130 RepID=A0A8H3QDG4_9GLOM|nr:alpha/beta hydrolase protein [Rhizophagus clarus]